MSTTCTTQQELDAAIKAGTSIIRQPQPLPVVGLHRPCRAHRASGPVVPGRHDMSTCELTMLPADMCSHCRGLDPVVHRGQGPIQSVTTAKFPGRCEACEEHIQEGDRLALVDLSGGGNDEWIHRDCATSDPR